MGMGNQLTIVVMSMTAYFQLQSGQHDILHLCCNNQQRNLLSLHLVLEVQNPCRQPPHSTALGKIVKDFIV